MPPHLPIQTDAKGLPLASGNGKYTEDELCSDSGPFRPPSPSLSPAPLVYRSKALPHEGPISFLLPTHISRIFSSTPILQLWSMSLTAIISVFCFSFVSYLDIF